MVEPKVSSRPRIAFDVGPLHGHRTGIGTAVQGLFDALTTESGADLHPYLLSFRATDVGRARRLPFPAAAAHRWWSRPAPPHDLLLGRPDLVHGTNYVVPPARCARLVSVYDTSILEHPEDAHAGAGRVADVLRRAVATGAHVLSCSESTAERVRDLLATDRVTTVPLGPPARLVPDQTWPEELSAHRDHPFVLSVGTIERRKNVPSLVAAFARLAAEHATVRLVIAGASGNDQRAVADAVERLDRSVRERVVLLGPVSAELKNRLLSTAAALAYVSLDEGFGFPLLEAQQFDVPIVASTAGSIPEVAGAAALFSGPGDIDAIAANLHLAITSDSVRSKLSAQAIRNLERFSWPDCARRVTDLYHTLANGS